LVKWLVKPLNVKFTGQVFTRSFLYLTSMVESAGLVVISVTSSDDRQYIWRAGTRVTARKPDQATRGEEDEKRRYLGNLHQQMFKIL
jgi:hypothetical protein